VGEHSNIFLRNVSTLLREVSFRVIGSLHEEESAHFWGRCQRTSKRQFEL